jgi:hypothetical protein
METGNVRKIKREEGGRKVRKLRKEIQGEHKNLKG